MTHVYLKTPVTYYGGKQHLAEKIVPLITRHVLYAEPFTGGAAIFFAKHPSEVEVLNDTNGELINLYRTIQQNYDLLYDEIKVTLHSRQLHRHARVVYNNPDMFSAVKRAWATWVLCCQTFSSMIDGGWRYDITSNTMNQKLQNKIAVSDLRGSSLRKLTTSFDLTLELPCYRADCASGSKTSCCKFC